MTSDDVNTDEIVVDKEDRYAFGTYESTQTKQNADKKLSIANYHIHHQFLVPEDRNADDYRETSAHIFVGPGTAPGAACASCLTWMEKQWERRPFTITWYSLDTPTTAAILEFKRKHPMGISAAGLYICCQGEVDQQLAFPVNAGVEKSLSSLSVKMNESFLGAHRFDPATGEVYFYFEREVEVQRAAAMLKADRKFLFLDDSKLTSFSGTVGYGIEDVIRDARSLTIYTSESNEAFDKKVSEDFSDMVLRTFDVEDPEKPNAAQDDIKTIQLIFVNNAGESVKSSVRQRVLLRMKPISTSDHELNSSDSTSLKSVPK